ncbi:MAG: glycosyltransferase family 9 protein [Endomicrobiia bacterium]
MLSIKTMKFIDKYFGIALCFLIGNLKKIIPYRISQKEIRKILIIKFWGLGSIVFLLPLITEIRKKYPKAKIYFLTLLQNKQLAELVKSIDEVITLRIGSLLHFIFASLNMVVKLRTKRFDLLYDCEFFARFSAIVSYLSGAKETIGYYSSNERIRGALYTKKVLFDPTVHVSKAFMKILDDTVMDFDIYKRNEIKISDEACKNVEKLLLRLGIKNKFVCINVNTSLLALERRWPQEYFVKVIDYITSKNISVVLTGADWNRNYVEKTRQKCKNKEIVFNLSGEIPIEQLLVIFEKCLFFITSDSGPLHLASLVGTPTISFFGPETPNFYGPVGDNNIVFFKNLECSPCMKVDNFKDVKCLYNAKCIKEIKPEEVIKVIQEKFGI